MQLLGIYLRKKIYPHKNLYMNIQNIIRNERPEVEKNLNVHQLMNESKQ